MNENNELSEKTNAREPGTALSCPSCKRVPCHCPGGGGGGSGDENQEESESIETPDNSCKSSEKLHNIGVSGSSVLAATTFTLFTKNIGNTSKLQPGAKTPNDQKLTGAVPPANSVKSSSIPNPFATPRPTPLGPTSGS